MEEYIKMMLPPENFFIPQYLIDNQAREYIEKLRAIKRMKQQGPEPFDKLIIP